MSEQNNSTAKAFLFQIPPDLEALRRLSLTPAEATALARAYAEKCWEESLDYTDDIDSSDSGYLAWCNREPDLIPGLHSTFLLEVMEALLDCGADPNSIVEGNFSLVEYVVHTVNGYVAADTLRMMLERGLDPDLQTDAGRLFSLVDFDIGFDAVEQYDRRRYDSLIHCWMVLIAFGGRPENGTTPLDLYADWHPFLDREFDVAKLKDHRNYGFCLTHTVNRGNSPTIHIFDKRTYWEVARL